MANTTTTGASAPASTNILGRHPEDICGIVEQAKEALDWLDHLCSEINELSRFKFTDEASALMVNLVAIQRLSGMGRYLAESVCGYVGYESEQMRKALDGETNED
jgi:hypothetical protein